MQIIFSSFEIMDLSNIISMELTTEFSKNMVDVVKQETRKIENEYRSVFYSFLYVYL